MKSIVTLTFSLFAFRLIEELIKELRSKDVLITELRDEKTTQNKRVGELEGQVQELTSALLQKDKDVEVIFSLVPFSNYSFHLQHSKCQVGSLIIFTQRLLQTFDNLCLCFIFQVGFTQV